ncbi:uncharacterized protein PRCAT00003908001 [Priceomyces carsonii]|uniref:uncharacterized protein n=1 Tax=Priceomyces carsonii TaxID=28549 RepID=UPI002EDA257D|nr:unnamed protein product [Priceomyces carsonii]
MLNSILPVFEEDIFLKLRPFPAEPTNLYAKHWHEVLGSFLFYFLINKLSPLFSKRYLGRLYTDLSVKTRINFDIHVVGMVQCLISIAILLPMWNHKNWSNRVDDVHSSIFGYTPYGGFVSSMTVGYFAWDLMVCVQYFRLFGIGFLLHAFAALYVFICALRPYSMPWAPAFLLFELSSPFVNINWFASRLPQGTFSEKTILINGLLLLFTFFSVRIAWGFYAVSLIAYDMFRVRSEAPIFLPLSILGLNLVLDVLNVYWFSKMLRIAYKKLTGTDSTKKLTNDATEKVQ